MAQVTVVAAVLVKGQRVLLGRRTSNRTWSPNVWDLPGGHVAPSESPPDALARELREELGVRISPPTTDPVMTIDAAGFRLLVWVLTGWEGEVSNQDPGEHDALGWFDSAALAALDLADHSYRALLLAILSEEGPSRVVKG